MSERKFIFWDWNCTLLDDASIILVCANIALKKLAASPVSMEKFRDIQSSSLKQFYDKAGISEDKIYEALKRERDIFHDHYEPLADGVSLRPGARTLLEKLKASNVSNVILSNHIVGQIDRLLKRHEIDGLFDDILAFADRKTQFRDMTKTDRLKSYLEEKNLKASNAAVVGDTTEEIHIGQTLGMPSVAITGGLASEETLRAAKPDYMIHSLEEMPPILQKLGFAA